MNAVGAPWRRLVDGSDCGVVLCVDFGGSRPEASFDDFAPLSRCGSAIWNVSMPDAGAVDASNPDRYLDWWLADPVCGDAPVRAVLSWCAGASLAGALVDRIERIGGRRPPLVCVEPATAGSELMRFEFDEAMKRLSEYLPLDDVDATASAADEGSPSVARLAVTLAGHYAAAVKACFAELGIDDDLGDEMQAQFASYLDYLAACARTTTGGTATAVVVSPAYRGNDVAGPIVRVDAARDVILSDPAAARIIDELIG